jgi:hypothetical protein
VGGLARGRGGVRFIHLDTTIIQNASSGTDGMGLKANKMMKKLAYNEWKGRWYILQHILALIGQVK